VSIFCQTVDGDPSHSDGTDRLGYALRYHRQGLRVIRARGKAPVDEGWPTLQADEASLHAWFGNGADYNVGVVTGERSGNLADVDLDAGSAVAVADALLPKTGWVFGRPSHPRSHRLYRADRVGANVELKDPLRERNDPGAMIVELRGNGRQTIFPPSRHAPSGETVAWVDFAEPASVTWNELAAQVYRVAAAALLTRYWPAQGGRHAAALALGGALAHAGFPQEDAERLVRAVAGAVGDPEGADRVRAVADSYSAHQAGEKVTGWPRLLEAFGTEKTALVDRVRDWLGTAAKLTRGLSEPAQEGKGCPESGRASVLEVRCLNGVKPEPVEYLVDGYIPLAKVCLFAGCGGMGKSIATLDLAAAVSTARPAFGLAYPAPPPGEALLCFAEDDAGDTVVPRLLAAGADLSRVHEVQGLRGPDGKLLPFSLNHVDLLAAELGRRPDVRLVVIDPAGVFAGRTGIDTHKEAPVQAMLAGLRDLAVARRVAVVLVAHVNKSEEQKARNRVSGSAAFVNSARAAFLFTEDAEDPGGRRLVLPIKFNCGREPPGLVYGSRGLSDEERAKVLPALAHLDEGRRQQLLGQLVRLDWQGQTNETADEVLARKRGGEKDADRAAEWLGDFLAPRPVGSEECVRQGNEALKLRKRLKWWRDAVLKGCLEGRSRKTGFGEGQRWWFTLPSHRWPFPGLEGDAEGEEAPAAPRGPSPGRETEESEESEESTPRGGDAPSARAEKGAEDASESSSQAADSSPPLDSSDSSDSSDPQDSPGTAEDVYEV
jgi:hypothetical protein